jgi:hypothetical protein
LAVHLPTLAPPRRRALGSRKKKDSAPTMPVPRRLASRLCVLLNALVIWQPSGWKKNDRKERKRLAESR